VRRRGEACGVEEFGGLLAEQPAQNIEQAPQHVGAPRKRGGEPGLEQRSFGDAHIDQRVIAIVEQDLRIEHHDHVDAEEHAHHVLVEEHVDRGFGLRIGAIKIEHHAAILAPHRAFDLVGAVTHAVVADVVLEADFLFADRAFDELLHRAVVAIEQQVGGRNEHIVAEAPGHLDHAVGGNAA